MDSATDDAVAATNDDAALCKFAAVTNGYYKDPFLDQFLPGKVKNKYVKKAPEINRGYYARSASIAYLVEKFIEANPSGQIISLGAGYDSLYWRLNAKKILSNENDTIKYVEIDMSMVTIHKLLAIKRHPVLSEVLTNIQYKGEGLHSDQYHLISFDLRQVDKESLKSKLINECGLNLTRPTLCIAECVLVYMPCQDSSSLIQWLAKTFVNLTMLNYEQCNMEDRFGDIMLAHMNDRHCNLLGVESCKSLESQAERFKSNGLVQTKAWTLSDIYSKYLSPAEVKRIEEIEFLDEKELLEQLLQHYCIVIASHQSLDWFTEEEYWLAKTL